jgi:hypothetical protein
MTPQERGVNEFPPLFRTECPNRKITREMGEFEAPLSNRKIRKVLGYKDVHDWRKYVK